MSSRPASSRPPLLRPVLLLVLALAPCLCVAAKSPPGEIRLVTAGQQGLLKGMGSLNPHAYRPNEFVLQNWVYEGLVHYGPGGKIVPALAESWDVQTNGRQQDITFNLRKGVKFHDGQPWNAAAAKANLDQIFAGPLKTGYHGWYELPKYIQSWEVVSEYVFKLSMNAPYYPALQELTLIRPVRFISPARLPKDPRQKSCPPTTELSWPTNAKEFECVGITRPAGTGPMVFEQAVTSKRTIKPEQLSAFELEDGEVIKEVKFTRNRDHWDTQTGNIHTFHLQLLPTLEAVGDAVSKGEVDMVYGLDTLSPQFFRDLHSKGDSDSWITEISGPLSTRVLRLNSGNEPLSSLAVRKALLHSVNKQHIIRNEMAGLELPAHQLFPPSLPYCDVELHPLIAYDRDKAELLLDEAGWVRGVDGKRAKGGKKMVLRFLFKPANSIQKAIEDDIRADLEDLGIGVTPLPVTHDEFNTADVGGEWDIALADSYGQPYDPHSWVNEFKVWPGHVKALSNLSAKPVTEGFRLKVPANNATFSDAVSEVLVTVNQGERAKKWADILTILHEQAMFLPISSLVNVAALDQRYENFGFGAQQFDVPVHRLVDQQLLQQQQSGGQGKLSPGAIAGIVISSVVGVLAIGAVVMLVMRERRGDPLFAPLLDKNSPPQKDMEITGFEST